MNPWLRRILAFFAGIGFFFGAAAYANYLVSPIGGDPVMVDIPRGATGETIAHRLKDAGAIRSPLAFKVFARFWGGEDEMKAGLYRISREKGVLEIIDQLVRGAAEQQWVTVPEGKNVSQVATLLRDQGLARYHEFLRAARRRPSAYGLDVPAPWGTCEGYLMPDSYKVARQITERGLIKAMLENWSTKVWEPNKAAFEASPFPPDKILVIAAMIEREARVPQDRELISSVIRNRLAKKMRLQIDATVLYAHGRTGGMVTFADLKVKSPYNTYLKWGLPPGPICSPGAASIEAALKPAKTDYLYYVAQPDGSHIFTRTHAEHQAAIARVRQMKKSASNKS